MPNTDIEFSEIAQERNGDWQHLVKHCLDFYSGIKDSEYRKGKIEEIKEARKVYEQKSEPKSFPWPECSNVVMPMTTITVDNQEPRLIAGLIGKEPYVKFEQQGLDETEEEVQAIQEWYNNELKYTVKLEDVSMGIVHNLLLEGTVYPVAEYSLDEMIRRDFVLDEQGRIAIDPDTQEAMTEDRVETVFEGGHVDFVDFNDMYVPDNATDWEKTDFVRSLDLTYGELMRFKDKKGYQNIGPWLLKETEEEIREEEQSPAQGLDDVKVTGQETIKCLECHMSYVYQDIEQPREEVTDFTQERVVALITAETHILIRLVLLRDLNFQNEHLVKRLRLFPERGKAYGTGIYGKMKAIQHGASKLFNLVIDIATVCMIPWFIYSDKAGLQADIALKPGEGVKADDPSQVVFPKFGIQPNAYIDFINLFVSLWERVGAIGDLQLGRRSESGGGRTATEALAVIQEGNVKHNYQSRVFKEEFLSLLRTIYDLYYQHLPLDYVFTYQGQKIQLPKPAMRRPVQFRLTGSTELSNRMIQRKEAEDFYTLTHDNPLVNQVERLKALVTTYHPDDSPEDWLDNTVATIAALSEQFPELPQIMMKYAQDKMAQAQELEAASQAGARAGTQIVGGGQGQ